jgi:hypothetical protein
MVEDVHLSIPLNGWLAGWLCTAGKNFKLSLANNQYAGMRE